MNLEDFVELLDGARRIKNGYLAKCPAHLDRTPSLTVSEGDDGRLLLFCHAGCQLQSVLDALRLHITDLFQSGPPSRRQTVSRRMIRRHAVRLDKHAGRLQLRANALLLEATGVDIASWSEDEVDMALNRIADAYDDLRRASILEGVADDLLQRGPHGTE